MKRHPTREKIIGARIRQARVQRGLSQTALAERLGLSFQQVQKYELGKDRVAASTLIEIAAVLYQPAAWFLEDAEGEEAKAEPTTDHAEIRAALRAGDALHRVSDPTVRRRLLALVEAVAALGVASPEQTDVAAA